MNQNVGKSFNYCQPLLVNEVNRENAAIILSELAKSLSTSPISKKGLFYGNIGLCLFLLSYSDFIDDTKLTNIALARMEESFNSINNPENNCSLKELINKYSMEGGLLGIDIGLTFCHESGFFEVDQHTFSVLDLLLNEYLFVDNLIDFSVSTGVIGIGLYLVSKLKSNRISIPTIKSENEQLLKKVLWYSDLSFRHKVSSGFDCTWQIKGLYIDKIEHSYIPLLCESQFIFSDKAEFLDKLNSASYKLKSYDREKAKDATWSVYDKLLLANSLYIASTYLNDRILAEYAFQIAESAVRVALGTDLNNLSLGNGLAGIMYLCNKLYCFQNSPGLHKAINQTFEIILAGLEKRIMTDTIKDSDHSLCYGLSGTAISILSLISEKPSNWDSLFGLGKPYKHVESIIGEA